MEISSSTDFAASTDIDMNRVLIVDDDTSYSKQVVLLCQKLGYETTATGNPEDFVDQLKTLPDIHAVIIDQFIGESFGLDLIPVVRGHNKSCRIMVLTGFANFKSAIEAGRYGADEYLTKPVSLASLKNGLSGAVTPFLEKHPNTIPLEEVEWEYINRVLTLCAGNVSQTARCLGLHRRTLQRKLARRRESS